MPPAFRLESRPRGSVSFPFLTAMSLTNHLVSLSISASYLSATQHPFLTAAGNSSLPNSRLALWLSQDRIYAAHAYPRFIGLLISHIPFSSSDALTSAREKRNQKILKVLVFALENIVKEAAFFKETSDKWNLDLECWVERKATRDYTAEMARVSSCHSLEDGLIFLWAMERVCIVKNPHLARLKGMAKRYIWTLGSTSRPRGTSRMTLPFHRLCRTGLARNSRYSSMNLLGSSTTLESVQVQKAGSVQKVFGSG